MRCNLLLISRSWESLVMELYRDGREGVESSIVLSRFKCYCDLAESSVLLEPDNREEQ